MVLLAPLLRHPFLNPKQDKFIFLKDSLIPFLK